MFEIIVYVISRGCIPDIYRRAMPPSQSGPDISHIPLYPDVDEDCGVDEFHQDNSFENPCSPPKSYMKRSRKNSERRSKSKHMGIMISDLLSFDESGTNRAFETALSAAVPDTNQDFNKSEYASNNRHQKVSTYLSDMLKRKPRNLKLARIAEAEALEKLKQAQLSDPIKEEVPDKSETSVSPPLNDSLPIKVISPKITSPTPVPKKVAYQNHFPELGAPLATSPPSPRELMKKDEPLVSNTRTLRGKKLSQKQRKKLEEERRKQELEKAARPTQPVSNAWGVPAR